MVSAEKAKPRAASRERLVGSAEVLELLGPPGKPLPPSTLSRWRRSGDFPAPLGEPRMGPVWKLSAVQAFAKKRGLPRSG